MRRPTDRETHPVHREIEAPVDYLPEYLWREPARVLRAWWRARRRPAYRAARRAWLADWRRDPTPNRGRRFGQALVLADELPADVDRLHVHFLHTPASVVRYASLLTGLPWTASAHAKDIWTTPEWEKAEKLAACDWLVTCTAGGAGHLREVAVRGGTDPAKIELVYHGLDLGRFPPPPSPRPARDGGDPTDPVTILSVGRLVPKKGYDDLLDALAALPPDVHWRLVHIGGGKLGRDLRRRADRLGLADRIEWRGARAQAEVIAACRAADLFVLASKVAGDGDRDGLPNVLMEAQSQALACLSTRVSGVPELIEDGVTGVLVPPGDAPALAAALAALAADPALRGRLGTAGADRVRRHFSMNAGIDRLARKFGLGPAGGRLADGGRP